MTYSMHSKNWNLLIKTVSNNILRMTYLPPKGVLAPSTPAIVHDNANHLANPVGLDGLKWSEGLFEVLMTEGSVEVKYQGHVIAIDEHIDPTKPSLKTRRLQAAAVFGLGEKYAWMNRIGTRSSDWCTDVIGKSPLHHGLMSEYHTAVPFFQTMLPHSVVGRFFDTSYKNAIDLDASGEGYFELTADGGQLDLYLIVGQTVQEVTRSYADLTGKMPLPRLDFLGYQQCRWSYMDESEVLSIAKQFRTHKIPLDVIYLDIDYMDQYKVFTHDPVRFGNIEAMNASLKEMGIKTVAIVDPGVKVEKDYSLYEEGIKHHYFVQDESKKPYVGQVWPGASVYPDFLRTAVRRWWGNQHKYLLNLGIDGIWNDMNEPSDSSTEDKTLPTTCIHVDDAGRKHYHAEIHNLYGHYEAMATYGALREQQGQRPFLLTRAAFAGTQRYSALWTGDNSSLWEHLEASIPMLVNLGLSGFGYVGGDVGGFLNDSNGELLVRWTQFGAFMPLFRNHSSKGTLYQEPWCFGEEVMNHVKSAIETRYRFMTYLYSRLYECSVYGDPVLRPLFYDTCDMRTYSIQDQCLFGSNILLAPVYRPGARERLVYLPAGHWYQFGTQNRFVGGQSYIIETPLETMPIFIKEGAVIPQDPIRTSISGPSESVELHLYGGKTGEGTLYIDDGLTFEYEQENCLHVDVRYQLTEDVVEVEIRCRGEFNEPSFNIVLQGNLKGKMFRINNIK